MTSKRQLYDRVENILNDKKENRRFGKFVKRDYPALKLFYEIWVQVNKVHNNQAEVTEDLKDLIERCDDLDDELELEDSEAQKEIMHKCCIRLAEIRQSYIDRKRNSPSTSKGD